METETEKVPVLCSRFGCRKPLDDEQVKHCAERRIVAVCPDCEKWFDEQLKVCSPLFQKTKLF